MSLLFNATKEETKLVLEHIIERNGNCACIIRHLVKCPFVHICYPYSIGTPSKFQQSAILKKEKALLLYAKKFKKVSLLELLL